MTAGVSPETNPTETGFATKRHKNPGANAALKAPIGARNIEAGTHRDFLRLFVAKNCLG
jgi:hypothetical protein